MAIAFDIKIHFAYNKSGMYKNKKKQHLLELGAIVHPSGSVSSHLRNDNLSALRYSRSAAKQYIIY
ncbi:MAG: hypothetical protein WCQ99_12950 [Pseudomonadota bacterium]